MTTGARIERLHVLPAILMGPLRNLWNSEYPVQLSLETNADLDVYLAGLVHQVHWLVLDGAEVIAWSLTFNRENRRWFAIIVAQKVKGCGLGRQLMQQMMDEENALEGWVTDHDKYVLPGGQPYVSPLPFYLKLGFKVVEGERLETEKLSLAKIYWQK